MWRISGNNALWESERLQAAVALSFPARGLSLMRLGGSHPEQMGLSQVNIPSRDPDAPQPVEDHYVRGADLIVTYGEAVHSPVHPQVYWRIVDDVAASDLIVVDTIVSNQTQLLDTDPRMMIACTLSGDAWLLASGDIAPSSFRPILTPGHATVSVPVSPPGCAVITRLKDVPWSYGQIFRAADLLDATLSRNEREQTTRLSVQFFGARLEKGVIRRACNCGVLVPRDRDIELAAKHFDRLLQSAPPLTV